MLQGGMDINKLMKQAQEMQKKAAETQQALKEMIVEATAGGGMISVKISGTQEVVDIKVDKEVINPDDKAMLEELLIAAVNEALKKSRKLSETEMAKVTGGLKIPGF